MARHPKHRPTHQRPGVGPRSHGGVDAWIAFPKLGGNATANFEILGGGERVPFGDEVYMAVDASSFARTSSGQLIHISTRTPLSDGETVIVGFVIEDRPRGVLVRAVGPSLARIGVAGAHPDPWLAVMRGMQTNLAMTSASETRPSSG